MQLLFFNQEIPIEKVNSFIMFVSLFIQRYHISKKIFEYLNCLKDRPASMYRHIKFHHTCAQCLGAFIFFIMHILQVSHKHESVYIDSIP